MTATATGLADLPGTGVAPALCIDPDKEPWTLSVDVLVVGEGAAGVSAALEARELGARVAVVDRFCGGGTTARSGSVMYAGGGTRVQRERGVEDTPDNMFNYLRHEVGGIVSDDTLRRFCEESPGHVDWVCRHGVRYSGRLFPAKTSYPVPGYSLYFSGNEMVFTDDATPAPRGHLADGIPAFTAFGPAFVGPLLASAERLGIQHLYQTRVSRLLTDADGRVVGVEAQQIPANSKAAWAHRFWSALAARAQIYYAPAARGLRAKLEAIERRSARTIRIRANKGVILATGGFILNKDLTERYLPKYRRAMRLGTPGDMGDGLALGVSVGGIAEHLGNATAWRFINPPPEWPRGILVDRQGQRYVNEASYGATIGTKMMESHRGEAILILDQPLYERSLSQLNLRHARLVTLLQAKGAVRGAKSAETLEALADRCGIPRDVLRATVEQYNRTAVGTVPDALGKKPSDMHALSQGPFHAIDMSVGKGDITSVITLGGLRVCEQTGAVTRVDGTTIEGLYAAGRAAIGVASHAYVSGLSIADGVFSGRRAARHAATRKMPT